MLIWLSLPAGWKALSASSVPSEVAVMTTVLSLPGTTLGLLKICTVLGGLVFQLARAFSVRYCAGASNTEPTAPLDDSRAAAWMKLLTMTPGPDPGTGVGAADSLTWSATRLTSWTGPEPGMPLHAATRNVTAPNTSSFALDLTGPPPIRPGRRAR